jgi:hypothetical protein
LTHGEEWLKDDRLVIGRHGALNRLAPLKAEPNLLPAHRLTLDLFCPGASR